MTPRVAIWSGIFQCRRISVEPSRVRTEVGSLFIASKVTCVFDRHGPASSYRLEAAFNRSDCTAQLCRNLRVAISLHQQACDVLKSPVLQHRKELLAFFFYHRDFFGRWRVALNAIDVNGSRRIGMGGKCGISTLTSCFECMTFSLSFIILSFDEAGVKGTTKSWRRPPRHSAWQPPFLIWTKSRGLAFTLR